MAGQGSASPPGRLRDFGIAIGRYPAGRFNAITDVAGVRVGHETIVSGSGPLVRGQGPVRTGVTVVLPGPEPWDRPRFAGFTGCPGSASSPG